MIRVAVCISAALAIVSAMLPWYSNHLQTSALKKAEMGFQAGSLHSARRAVTVNPLSVEARFVLAGVQNRLGREDTARETLISATELEPENYETWIQLAMYERDFWDEPKLSGEHFEIAVSLNPHDKQLKEEAGLTDE